MRWSLLTVRELDRRNVGGEPCLTMLHRLETGSWAVTSELMRLCAERDDREHDFVM